MDTEHIWTIETSTMANVSHAAPLSSLSAAELLQLVRALSPEDKAAVLDILKEKFDISEEQYHCYLYDVGQCNTNNDTYQSISEKDLWMHAEYRVHKNMLLYIPPIILFIGTIGNILSFMIMTRKPMRKLSTYRYLAALSITDTLVLYVGLLRIWIRELTGYDLQNMYNWSCGVVTMMAFTVSDYSVWLIIAVTVERYIAVCHPLRAPALCNQRKAFRVMIAILLALLCINLHFLWTTSVNITSGNVTKCEHGQGFEAVADIWPWVDAFIYSYIPVVMISIFNGLIIYHVILSKKERKNMCAPKQEMGRKASTGNHLKGASDRIHRSSAAENSFKVTFMLLTISFAFLITTLPMNSMLIANALLGKQREAGRIALLKMIRSITELLMYLNHSMNFFLYCATGEKFRQQLVALFRPRRHNLASGVRSNLPLKQMDSLCQLNPPGYDRPRRFCFPKTRGSRPLLTVTYSTTDSYSPHRSFNAQSYRTNCRSKIMNSTQ